MSLYGFSTKQARQDEQRRRKLRRELLKTWQSARATLDAEKLASVKSISDAEWSQAQEDDKE